MPAHGNSCFNSNLVSIKKGRLDMPETKGFVIADKLNVRLGKGTEFAIVCQLARSSMVEIKSQLNSWKELSIDNFYGYVNRVYIALNQPEKI